MRRRLAAVAGVAGVAFVQASPGWAGPPYMTDDPEPTDRGRWEVYDFVAGAHVAGDTAGEAGLDLNYGAARDLQLTTTIPAAYERSDRTHLGLGVVELAAKLKVLHQDRAGLDVAVFPRLFLPTAPARFASRHANLLLPVWAGRDVGPWSVFGGGGYQLNPGAGHRDFWTGGLAVTRSLGDRLSVGGEVYGRTRDSAQRRDFTGLNLGFTYRFAEHWSLLAAGGPGLQNARQEGRYAFYLALKAD